MPCRSQKCLKNYFKKRLPPIKWIPKYSCQHFQGDVIAGLTVALTVIPQGLAYGQIAHLPAQYGLYSAFLCCFIYCILGTAKDVTLGPTAIMSMLVAHYSENFGDSIAFYAIALSFYCGIVQLILGILNLGIIVDFVSSSVLSAFTGAAALTIAGGQLKHLLGIKNTTRSGDLLDQLITVFTNISTINKYDVILSAVCIVLLIFLKQLRSVNWPGPPTSILQTVCRKIVWLTGTASNGIIVLSSAGVAASLISKNINVFSMTKGVAKGLPPFRPPHLSTANTTSLEALSNIGTGLIMIPLIGIVELMAIGKVLARRNDYTIDCSQELIAIGVANIFGSFVSAYPVTGSFSRSIVQSNSGAKTTSAGLFTGTIVIICLASLMDFVRFIPSPALASVIFCAVLPMFNPSALIKYWKLSKLDGFIWFLTFILSIPLGIEVGLAIGMGFSLCFFVLYPSARPRIVYDFQENYTIMKIFEKLTFAGSEYLGEEIRKQLRHTNVILDLTSMNNLDPSVALILSPISREVRSFEFIMTASKEVEIILKKVDIKCASSINDCLREIRYQ